MANAAACHAPGIAPAREKTGSTDFGNVMSKVPGCCIRVKFVPSGTSSHTQTFVDCGKNEDAHLAILVGAKTLAGTVCDILTIPDLLKEIQTDFEQNRFKV
jgi:metal-dependent amidase/aminoacylase/carboxypeptidase family protein